MNLENFNIIKSLGEGGYGKVFQIHFHFHFFFLILILITSY